ILLGALAGFDPADPATRASQGHWCSDYTSLLQPDGLRGARLGVARQFFKVRNPDASKLLEAVLARLQSGGAILVDPADLPKRGDFGDSEMEVLLYEFKADLKAYLASRAG